MSLTKVIIIIEKHTGTDREKQQKKINKNKNTFSSKPK
jgi:hypothetical protein